MSSDLTCDFSDSFEPLFMHKPVENFLVVSGIVLGTFFTWLWLFSGLIS